MVKAKPRGERGWWLERLRGHPWPVGACYHIMGRADSGTFYDGVFHCDRVHVALWRLCRLQRRKVERLEGDLGWMIRESREIGAKVRMVHNLLVKEASK